MVLNLRRRLRLGVIAAALATGGIVSAQAPAPNSLPALQQSVSQRTAEWNTLATNLEQRVARLLPCDPQARAAIDEVSRASDARGMALTSYWTLASLQSKAQIDAIRRLLAQEEGRSGDWAVEATQARAEVALVAALGASLASSVSQVAALASPRKDLEAIEEEYRLFEKQSQERTTSGGQLLGDLRDLLKASQARQAAIDERLQTVGVEGQRWSAYYAARQARAQVECALVNPGAAVAPPGGPRSAPLGKKQ